MNQLSKEKKKKKICLRTIFNKEERILFIFKLQLEIYLQAMKHSRISKTIPIKSKHELQLFKKREANPIEGSLRLILGKQQNELQQIWFQEFRNCAIQELRDLHSNELAFDWACLIAKASHKLAQTYGYFILNENMVFKTLNEQLFIWINPDIFCNQSKIFLPETHEGEISMIKSLINYFKLWLHTDYVVLSQIKTLEQLEFKIYSLKSKSHSSNANSTKVESECCLQNKNSNSTSKHLDQKFSYKSKNIGKYTPSIKGSQPNQLTKSFNSKLGFKHMFNVKGMNNVSGKQSQSNYEKHQDFQESPNQPMSSMSRTTGASNNKYYPFKTTSANSKKILSLIKKADENPDQYVSNNLKMDPQKLRQMEEYQKKKKMKQSLNEVGQELDNLFLSNMEQEEEDTQQLAQREKEFESILS